MSVNTINFLHSLCRYMVTRAAAFTPSLSLAYTTAPRDLFRTRVVEEQTKDIYSLVRIYTGPPLGNDPLPRTSLQVMTTEKAGATVAGGGEGALSRAQTLFETLCAADGLPLQMVTIAGYRASDDAADGHWQITSTDPLQRPGLLGTDERGRTNVSFNVDVAFVKID